MLNFAWVLALFALSCQAEYPTRELGPCSSGKCAVTCETPDGDVTSYTAERAWRVGDSWRIKLLPGQVRTPCGINPWITIIKEPGPCWLDGEASL